MREWLFIVQVRPLTVGTLQGCVAQKTNRFLQGQSPGKLLVGIAAAWSLFQLWIASPLPFLFRFGVFNATEARSIHLAFALFLAFMAYPALKRSPRERIPLQDWLFAGVAAFCGAYMFLFYAQLSERPGSPLPQDVVVGVVGILLLLEATRRALGPPLMIVAAVFIVYSLFGRTSSSKSVPLSELVADAKAGQVKEVVVSGVA